MIKIIAAIGKNFELGKNGTLIWHLPNDLNFFKQQTSGSIVFMGCTTFNSLPKKLPKRHHIVLAYKTDSFNKDISDVDIINSPTHAIKMCKDIGTNEDIYIIGGASIYKMFIDVADEIILTEIDAKDDKADVYFPRFDKTKYFKKDLGENSEGDIKYKHVLYIKK